MPKPYILALLLLMPAYSALAGDVFSATEDEMVVRNPEPLAIRKLPALKSRAPREANQIQHTPKKRKLVATQAPDAPRTSKKKQMAGVAAAARETALPAETRSPIQPSKELAEFDLVPKDQLEPLAKRMSLVEEIMRRHSRAYDYRAYTIKELQEILAQLEADAARAAETQVEAPREFKATPGTDGEISIPQDPEILPPPPGT